MMSSSLVLVELALVFGGLLVFGFWQLHSLRKENGQEREPEEPPQEPPT